MILDGIKLLTIILQGDRNKFGFMGKIGVMGRSVEGKIDIFTFEFFKGIAVKLFTFKICIKETRYPRDYEGGEVVEH
jgi:hypothetical protein